MLSVLICKDLKLSQEYNADESVYLFTIVLSSFCAIKVNTMPLSPLLKSCGCTFAFSVVLLSGNVYRRAIEHW